MLCILRTFSVAAGSKERTLTITAESEELIAFAKRLIDETIRRNVSPNRVSCTLSSLSTFLLLSTRNCRRIPLPRSPYLQAELPGTTGAPVEDVPDGGANWRGQLQPSSASADDADGGREDIGINIETGEDGVLKLSCADPKVLQVG